jgi:exodeoxyribonuclease VII large subunit
MFEQTSLFGPRILSVSGVTQYLRALMESDEILRDVWVSGEISTLSTPSSGHIYFTLKDSDAALKCVIWRAQAMRLRGRLQTGLAVEVHGAFSVYEAGGQYQLYVDTLRPAGEGTLYQEFIRLKARLEAEGLFDEERKRSLPEIPARIGIVTSPTGAALQDILNTLQNRYPLAQVVLAATPVQGQEAPAKIVKAIQNLNRYGNVDVILLARGGGSLEDLWAFNDEAVVRAVVSSEAPVVTGIGHETDFTLSDFAADLRAPTPTGAAVAVSPDRNELLRDLGGLYAGIESGFQRRLSDLSQNLNHLQQRLNLLSPAARVRNDSQRLDENFQRLERSIRQQMALRCSSLDGTYRRLESLNPLQVLNRGFALVRNASGQVIRTVEEVSRDAEITIRVADGDIGAKVTSIKKTSNPL